MMASSPKFALTLLPGEFAVCRMDASDAVPSWATRRDAPFTCIMRTREELSLVCPVEDVPKMVIAERGFRAFKLKGPVPFTTTGVISGLTAPLAAAGLSVFVLSTYDTDYLLVKGATLPQATKTLQAAGFKVS
jgi:hypothetical protein